jgi:thioredoxin 1
MPGVPSVTDADFDARVLEAEEPVLVAFSAPWCPPCRALEPVVEAIAEEYKGRVRVLEFDVGTQPAVAARYQIMVVPTVMVFSQGKIVGRESGLISKERLQGLVARAGGRGAPGGAC